VTCYLGALRAVAGILLDGTRVCLAGDPHLLFLLPRDDILPLPPTAPGKRRACPAPGCHQAIRCSAPPGRDDDAAQADLHYQLRAYRAYPAIRAIVGNRLKQTRSSPPDAVLGFVDAELAVGSVWRHTFPVVCSQLTLLPDGCCRTSGRSPQDWLFPDGLIVHSA